MRALKSPLKVPEQACARILSGGIARVSITALLILTFLTGTLWSSPVMSSAQAETGNYFDLVFEIVPGSLSRIEMTATFREWDGKVNLDGEPHCRYVDESLLPTISSVTDIACYPLSQMSDTYVDLNLTFQTNYLGIKDFLFVGTSLFTVRVGIDRSVRLMSGPDWMHFNDTVRARIENERRVYNEQAPSELPASGQQEPTAPAGTGSVPACGDAGIPQVVTPLTVSPQNPDTAATVNFSVTIKNVGCGTFAPEVLAIGGRDPDSNVSDPLQSRDFHLAPGESKTLSQSVTLALQGRHEFFMAYLRVNGGWNEIPDTSGLSQHVFIDVVDSSSSPQPPTDSTNGEASQWLSTENLSGTCVEGARPFIQMLQVGTDANSSTSTKQFQINISNPGCNSFTSDSMRVVDLIPENTMVTIYSLDTVQIDPMTTLVVMFDVPIDEAGEHKIWVEAETNDANPAVEVLLDDQGAYGVLTFGIQRDGQLGYEEGTDTPAEGSNEGGSDAPILSEGEYGSSFVAGCHYSWSWNPEFWNESCYGTNGNWGSALAEPIQDGCTYYFDGANFYQDYDYECWTANEPPDGSSTGIYSSATGEWVSGFSSGCTYSWSDWEGIWYESCSVGEYVLSNIVEPALSEPGKDGCDYYFDGASFYGMSWC